MSLVGGITALGIIFGAILRILAGFLADRIKPVKIMLTGIISETIALISIALLIYFDIRSIWIFSPFLILNFASFSFIIVGADTAISYIFPQEKIPDVLSKVRVGINLGFAFGPIIGGFLSEFSYSWIFILSAVLCLVFLAGTLKLGNFEKKLSSSLKKNLGYTGEKNLGYTGGKINDIVNRISPVSFRVSDQVSSGDQLYSTPVFDRHFLYLFFGVFFISVLVSQFINTLPIFAKLHGIPNSKIGYFFTLNGICVVLFQVYITRFAENFLGFYRSMLFGIVMYMISFFFISFMRSFSEFMFCVFIMTVGEMMLLPFLRSAVMIYSPTSEKGRYLGFFEFSEAIGAAFGRFLGNALFDFLGGEGIMWWIILLGGPFSIFFLRMFFLRRL